MIGNIYQLTNTDNMIISQQDKRLVAIVTTAFSLLLIPLVAMNFTKEVNWKIFDFIVAGMLLCGSGLILELILRKIRTRTNRMLLIAGLFFALMLVWAELAVGIFGTPIAGS